LVALLLATLLLVDSKRRLASVAFGSLLVVLVFIEHGDVSGYTSQAHFIPTPPTGGTHFVQQTSERAGLANFLKSAPGLQRISTNVDDVHWGLGDLYLLEDLGGGASTMLTQFFRLEPWRYRTQQLYGVTYYIAKKPVDPAQTLVASSASKELNIYSNSGVRPRAWAVHRLAGVSADSEFAASLNFSGFDMAQMATLQGPAPVLETCPGDDDVRLVSRTWFHSAIDATLGCRGMVILSDHVYPGWYASIDGQSVPIFAAYGALRGVVAGGGKHRIEFHFRPWSFIFGLALFSLAATALVVLIRLDHSREPDRLSLQLAY
jgi:hypothetical protein